MAEGVELVQKLNTPHNVNMFALRFARAIMERPGMLEGMIAEQREGKELLVGKLESRGYDFLSSEGNFMFIKPFRDASEIVRRMKDEKGILIKEYGGIGAFGDCLRVTTGPRASMGRFAQALFEIDVC